MALNINFVKCNIKPINPQVDFEDSTEQKWFLIDEKQISSFPGRISANGFVYPVLKVSDGATHPGANTDSRKYICKMK